MSSGPTLAQPVRIASVPANSFRRGFVATLGFDVMARALSAIATVALVRGLAVEDYAFVTLFLATGQFLASAAAGGVRLSFLRREAETVSRSGQSDESEFTQALLVGALATVALGGLFGLAYITLSHRPDPGEELVVGGLALAFALAQGVTELVIARHQARLAFRRAGVVAVARSALLLVVASLAFVGAASSGVMVSTLSVIAVGGLAVHLLRPLVGSALPRIRVRSSQPEARWLTAYCLLAAAPLSIDVFMVATRLGKQEVASYGAALRYFSLIMGATPALLILARVRTAQHDIVDSAVAQQRLLRSWLRRITLPAVGTCGVSAALAPLLIPLVDEGKYPESIPVLQLMMGAAFLVYVATPAASMLMTQQRFRLLVGLSVAGTLVRIPGEYLLADPLGVVGVAAASDAAYFISFGLALWFADGACRAESVPRLR